MVSLSQVLLYCSLFTCMVRYTSLKVQFSSLHLSSYSSTQVTKSHAVCEFEISAYNNCFFANFDVCHTVTCYNEALDFSEKITTQSSCGQAVMELCEAYICCSPCASLGGAVVDCAAEFDGCPQRGCSGAVSVAVLSGSMFFIAMTILLA